MSQQYAHTYSDDARLVARAQAGDRGAFRQLFDAYAPLVYRIAYRMVGNPDDAADLAQDIFMRAYERLASLKDGQAFKAWLTRLAANMANDLARRRKISPLSLDAPPPGHADGVEWALTDGTTLDTTLLSEERAGIVQQALLALSADHRLVVVLHHLEDMPLEQIAALLKVPMGTVKSRLARARADLRRLLEPYLQ